MLPTFLDSAAQIRGKTESDRICLDDVNKLLGERDALWQERHVAMEARLEDKMMARLGEKLEEKLLLERQQVGDILNTIASRTSAAPASPLLSRDPRPRFGPAAPNQILDEALLEEKIPTIVQPLLDKLESRTTTLVDDVRKSVALLKSRQFPSFIDRYEHLATSSKSFH